MGNASVVLKPAVLHEIAEMTSFSENEAKDLYRLFRQMAHASGGNPHKLSSRSFIQMFAESFPGVDCEKFSWIVFQFFDTDRSGDIDFSEFLIGLDEQIKSNPDNMVINAFTMFDTQKRGVITYDSTLDVVQALYDLHSGYLPLEGMVNAEKYVDRLFVTADRKEQGTMNLSAFKRAYSTSQTIRTLVDALLRAASRPYLDRQHQTGSIGRKRATTIVTQAPREPGESRKLSSNVPMRKFTV